MIRNFFSDCAGWLIPVPRERLFGLGPASWVVVEDIVGGRLRGEASVVWVAGGVEEMRAEAAGGGGGRRCV